MKGWKLGSCRSAIRYGRSRANPNLKPDNRGATVPLRLEV